MLRPCYSAAIQLNQVFVLWDTIGLYAYYHVCLVIL
jgi:hypothetical protein